DLVFNRRGGSAFELIVDGESGLIVALVLSFENLPKRPVDSVVPTADRNDRASSRSQGLDIGHRQFVEQMCLRQRHSVDPPHALSFCISASDPSKLAYTFCTSSCSLSASISRSTFSPCSSLTAIVFCGFHTSAALRGSPNFASSAFATSRSDSGVV